MRDDVNFRQLTQDYEQGKDEGACKLIKAFHEASFGEKIQALQTIQETNESDRSANPSLPELKISNETKTQNRFDKDNNGANKEICDFLTNKKGPCTENLQVFNLKGADFSFEHTMNLRTGAEMSLIGNGKGGSPKCDIW